MRFLVCSERVVASLARERSTEFVAPYFLPEVFTVIPLLSLAVGGAVGAIILQTGVTPDPLSLSKEHSDEMTVLVRSKLVGPLMVPPQWSHH